MDSYLKRWVVAIDNAVGLSGTRFNKADAEKLAAELSGGSGKVYFVYELVGGFAPPVPQPPPQAIPVTISE